MTPAALGRCDVRTGQAPAFDGRFRGLMLFAVVQGGRTVVSSAYARSVYPPVLAAWPGEREAVLMRVVVKNLIWCFYYHNG